MSTHKPFHQHELNCILISKIFLSFSPIKFPFLRFTSSTLFTTEFFYQLPASFTYLSCNFIISFSFAISIQLRPHHFSPPLPSLCGSPSRGQLRTEGLITAVIEMCWQGCPTPLLRLQAHPGDFPAPLRLKVRPYTRYTPRKGCPPNTGLSRVIYKSFHLVFAQ